MSQAPQLRLTKPGSPPGLPRKPLSPENQLQALRLVQDQAEHRVNLGMQLFKAAESHTAHQQELIEEIKTHQEQMRHEMQNDIASSLQTYDQWMATFDENFTRKLQRLEEKLDEKVNTLNGKWETTQKRIHEMVHRAEALLNLSRRMLKTAVQTPPTTPPPAKPQSKPSPAPATYAVATPPTQKFLPHSKPADPPARKTTPKETPKPNSVTPPTPTAHRADTPQSTKATAKQQDMIYSKALEHLKADSANKPPKNR